MKIYKLNLIAVASLVLLLLDSEKGYSQLDSIIHMRFSQVAPNLGKDLKVESYDTTIINVFDYNKIRLFQFNFPIGIYENNQFVRKEKRTQYYIQFKDSLTGYFTDSILGFINVKQKRDSVSILNMAFNDAIESDFKNLKMELFDTQSNERNHILIEKFKVFSKSDTTNPAIWKMTYDMTNNIWPLSLSKYLDTQKAGHLTEIDLFSPQKLIKSLKVQVEAYHFTHKLEYLGISNDEIILNRMKSFESIYKY